MVKHLYCLRGGSHVHGSLLRMAAGVRCVVESAKKNGGINVLYVPIADVEVEAQAVAELGGGIQIRGVQGAGDLVAMEEGGRLWQA